MKDARIQRVHCLPQVKPVITGNTVTLPFAPGHISLVVLPKTATGDDAKHLRAALWNFLDPRRLLTTQHHVIEPGYVTVSMTATLRLLEGARSKLVEQTAIAAVKRFFDPLVGGADGQGYPFGRNVYISEVYELLDGVPGVDYVQMLTLASGGESGLAEISLQDHQLVEIQFSASQLTLLEG